MILQSAGDDLRGGSRRSIHQHNDRVVAPVVAVPGSVGLLRRGAAMMRNDGLSLLQELVGHCHAFVQQPARVAAEVEDQAVNVVLA